VDKQEKYGPVKMKMSFFAHTAGEGVVALDKSVLEDAVKSAPSVDHTYGLRFRNPAVLDVEVTVEEALEIIRNNELLDAAVYENGHVSLNTFSENDMF